MEEILLFDTVLFELIIKRLKILFLPAIFRFIFIRIIIVGFNFNNHYIISKL